MKKLKELTPKSSQKAKRTPPKEQEWETFEIKDRFYKDFFKGAGFRFENCISELVDNSIGANAKKIQIETSPIDENKNLFNITIKDNGSGIPSNDIKNKLSLGSGILSEYKSNSISYYGVGMKFAIINLSDSGRTKITSINNREKSVIEIDTTNIPKISTPIVTDTNENNGTIIEIPNVEITSNKITGLLKFLGVTYFPHVDNGNELEIELIHNNESRIVTFTDPLYRHINKSAVFSNSIMCNDDEFFINDSKITIKARYFDLSFNSDDYTSWDKQQGSSGFSGQKSGVYFRLNGRYITLGDNKFYGTEAPYRSGGNRIRIEVDFDRDLVQHICSFNKSMIRLSDKDFMKTFKEKLAELANWGVKMYNQQNGAKRIDISTEAQIERKEIDRDIDSKRKKMNNDDIINAPELPKGLIDDGDETVLRDNEPKGKKKRPPIGTYNKASFAVEYMALNTHRAFDYFNRNGALIIIYNTNHGFYNNYIRMPQESKKLIDTYTTALCDSFNAGKGLVRVDGDLYDSIIDEILMVFSSRLKNYNND